MSGEKHYRRLLALYPRDHRERHGEEMLGVLLAADSDWRDDVNLVRGAIALHTRRVFNLDRGVPLRDVLAIVSLLGPIVLLISAVPDLRDLAAQIKSNGLLVTIPHPQPSGWPVWSAWTAVAVLALSGAYRLARAVAWVACAVHFMTISNIRVSYAANYETIGLLLLGVCTAIALTWSPGPAHGRELVGRRGIRFAFAGVAVSAVLLVFVTPSLYSVGFWAFELGPWLSSTALVLGGWLACRGVPDRRTGRHAAVVLALPLISNLVSFTLILLLGPALFWTPFIASALLYGIPLLIVLAGNGVLHRIKQSLPS